MTPEQLEIATAFASVTFKPGDDKKFADAFIATAKRSPGTELNDLQDKFVRDLAFRYRRQMPVGLVLAQVQHGFSTLSWVAPELARSGTIKNEPWVPESARRAVALFPNKSLHQCAAILAALHPYAFDYIAQAPVLVLAVAQGSSLSKVSERKRVSREWVFKFEQGGKLRDMMQAVGLAYPLRKLHPSVMESNQWETVQALCTIDASTLSQIIPAREDQKEWLQSIGQWIAQMKRRFNNAGLHFEWACRQLNPDNMRRTNQDVREILNQVANIADYAGQHGNRFNTRWTLDRALQETRRWHDEMARASHEQKFFLENGKQWDEPVDYTPFPRRVAMGEYLFTALQSGKELFEEGRDMHHCVGSYSRDVISGRSRIYAMVECETGRRVATIEFSHEKMGYPVMGRADARDYEVIHEISPMANERGEIKKYRPQWHMVQAKGPCNAALTKEEQEGVRLFEDRLNYYWAMFEHERKSKHDYELRLARVMLNPMPPLIINPDEFPGLDLGAIQQELIEQSRLSTCDRH